MDTSDIPAERPDVDHELSAGQDDLTQTPSATAAEAAPEPKRAIAELTQLQDRLARLQAEFENARKRTEREQQEFKELALADAIRELLPILDNLDRALQVRDENLDQLHAGVMLIRRQFADILFRLGVAPIPAKGKKFDPHLHEAIETEHATGNNAGQVVGELQQGYTLHGRLLRPALVRVAQASTSDDEEDMRPAGDH